MSPTVSSAGAAPTASATPSPSRPARDPFSPLRVKINEGTVSGHALEAWIALWPAAPTAADGLAQGRLIQQERRTVDPRLPDDPQGGGIQPWTPNTDRAEVYLTVDGKRQPGDFVDPVPGPGGTAQDDPGAVIGGRGLNRVVDTGGSPQMVVVKVRPEVERVVVRWESGMVIEAEPVAVGDSPVRWYAVIRIPGSGNNTVVSYAADGSVLRTQKAWW
ncbi:hypothetical protein [Kitasatospora sp. NPDC059827]|uniref:hypothetical protein n=1 Tax=Kitasatospora sp. NPDC059827 TaxID=3346964 RepID=UPI00364D2ADB